MVALPRFMKKVLTSFSRYSQRCVGGSIFLGYRMRLCCHSGQDQCWNLRAPRPEACTDQATVGSATFERRFALAVKCLHTFTKIIAGAQAAVAVAFQFNCDAQG